MLRMILFLTALVLVGNGPLFVSTIKAQKELGEIKASVAIYGNDHVDGARQCLSTLMDGAQGCNPAEADGAIALILAACILGVIFSLLGGFPLLRRPFAAMSALAGVGSIVGVVLLSNGHWNQLTMGVYLAALISFAAVAAGLAAALARRRLRIM